MWLNVTWTQLYNITLFVNFAVTFIGNGGSNDHINLSHLRRYNRFSAFGHQISTVDDLFPRLHRLASDLVLFLSFLQKFKAKILLWELKLQWSKSHGQSFSLEMYLRNCPRTISTWYLGVQVPSSCFYSGLVTVWIRQDKTRESTNYTVYLLAYMENMERLRITAQMFRQLKLHG